MLQFLLKTWVIYIEIILSTRVLIKILGSLNNYYGNSSENVTYKLNLRCFKLYRYISTQDQKQEKENRRLVFTSYITLRSFTS